MSSTTLASYGILNLGSQSRIPLGEGRIVRLGRFEIAIFRTRRGEFFATQAICPHKGGPLADGIIGERTITCPLHSCTYDLATGQATGPLCDNLKTYPLRVSEDGDLLLAMA